MAFSVTDFNNDLDDEKSKSSRTKRSIMSDDATETIIKMHHTLKFKFNERIDQKYLAETKQIYLRQCPSLKHQLEQQSLFHFLSFQRLYRYPLMLYIFDSFQRDKVRHYLIYKKDIKFDDWAHGDNTLNNLLKYIKDSKYRKRIKRVIVSAVNTYSMRYCLPLNLSSSTYIIRDSIDQFVKYIAEIVAFIASVMNNPIEILPFQLELLMIPHNVVDTAQSDEDVTDDDDDDDDSDFDDDVSDTDDDAPPKPTKIRDDIGDIDKNLKTKGIYYAKETVTDAGSIKKTMRELKNSYKRVFEEAKLQNIEQVQLPQLSLNASRSVGGDLKSIPHRKRLCIAVDRRQEDKDDIYMFQPPECEEIPSDHVYEWYIEASAQGLMPDRTQTMITSKTAMNGWINLFSFHVEAEDDIRCYLYRTGQILRFMPSDILYLFPYLFDLKGYNNEKYMKAMRKDPDDTLRNCQWKDCRFDKFREALTKKQKK